MENLFEKARRAIIEAFLYKDWTSIDDAFISLITSEELDFNLIPESARIPSQFVKDKEVILKQTARQTVFIVSLSPVFDLSRVPLGNITFYDVRFTL
jgi:hypothetical protein